MTWFLALYLLIGVEVHVYIVDYDLSLEDCTAALADNPSAPLRCEKMKEN